MKSGRIILHVNTHRLTESDFRFAVIVSWWRSWRHFMQKSHHLVSAYAASARHICSSVRQFLIHIVHSSLFAIFTHKRTRDAWILSAKTQHNHCSLLSLSIILSVRAYMWRSRAAEGRVRISCGDRLRRNGDARTANPVSSRPHMTAACTVYS